MFDIMYCVCLEPTENRAVTPCNHHPEPLCEVCFLKIICEAYFQRRIATCPLCRAERRPNDNEPESEQDSDNSDIDEDNYAMLVAAEARDKIFVRQMLDQGADDFNRALVRAALNNYLNMVKLMLEKGYFAMLEK